MLKKKTPVMRRMRRTKKSRGGGEKRKRREDGDDFSDAEIAEASMLAADAQGEQDAIKDAMNVFDDKDLLNNMRGVTEEITFTNLVDSNDPFVNRVHDNITKRSRSSRKRKGTGGRRSRSSRKTIRRRSNSRKRGKRLRKRGSRR